MDTQMATKSVFSALTLQAQMAKKLKYWVRGRFGFFDDKGSVLSSFQKLGSCSLSLL